MFLSLRHYISVGLDAPVAAVAVRGDNILAALVTGVVCFVSISSQKIWQEVQAHSRYLTAIDVHPSKDLFVTAAEDSTIAVWTLPEAGAKAEIKFATNWRDAMLTGVAFCGEGFDSIAATAYDISEVCVWQ